FYHTARICKAPRGDATAGCGISSPRLLAPRPRGCYTRSTTHRRYGSMKLPEKILYCRKRAGLSQEELAGRLGVSRQAVSKWETGEAQPELSKLAPLAAELGVSVDWLLSDAEPEEPRAEPERAEDWTDK